MQDGQDILTVTELTSRIKKGLESGFADIWVEGEVSNYYRHSTRHIYFDLKDKDSKIRVVMFYQNNRKLVFKIENGLHLILNGYVSVYAKRGEYQIIALDARPVGKGSLILAFEQLKKDLESRGYFDKALKKLLPELPRRIGLATSVGGAVLKDIISVLDRRSDNFHLIVRDINVQGPTSEEEICSAIGDLSEYGVDVIIIARGGGSLEDLWAFNTKRVAQRIFDCDIPVISAVGHETDFTICDFVSDMRAATPSVAAEIVMLDKSQLKEKIIKDTEKMHKTISQKMIACDRELGFLTDRRFFKRPQTLILKHWQNYEFIKDSLYNNIRILVKDKGNTIRLLIKDLESNSPLEILKKGYCLAYLKERKIGIKSIDQVDIGDLINLLFEDGRLIASVKEKEKKEKGSIWK